jgi:protein phosphatase
MATQVVLRELKTQVAEFRAGSGPHVAMRAVDQSINRANTAIFDAARASASYDGMGTTLALALFYDNRVTLGHVGDSRVYRLRGDTLELLTRDDSLLRDQVELGLISATDASESHNRSLVTRALGIGDSVAGHLREHETLPGDLFLLCSDGLNDLVEDTDIELILSALGANLPLAAHHLVQTAKDNGGYDNVSVILAKVLKLYPATSRRWVDRWFGWLQ